MCKWLWNQVMDRGWKNFESHDRNSLYCFKQTVGRTRDAKGMASEGSERIRNMLLQT